MRTNVKKEGIHNFIPTDIILTYGHIPAKLNNIIPFRNYIWLGDKNGRGRRADWGKRRRRTKERTQRIPRGTRERAPKNLG